MEMAGLALHLTQVVTCVQASVEAFGAGASGCGHGIVLVPVDLG